MILRITAESSTIRILSLRNGALLVEWWCWCESRKHRQRLPGSVKLNRPLQRRNAKSKATSKAGAASSAPTNSKTTSTTTSKAGAAAHRHDCLCYLYRQGGGGTLEAGGVGF